MVEWWNSGLRTSYAHNNKKSIDVAILGDGTIQQEFSDNMVVNFK